MTNMHTLNLNTEDDPTYQFFPISSGCVRFKVKTIHDAHVALFTGPQELDSRILVIIGGWGNTQSHITKTGVKNSVYSNTPQILSNDEFRGFWVRWENGIISAGRENSANPIMSWTDPEPFPIAVVGIRTTWKAPGSWKIEDGDEFETAGNNDDDYKLFPVNEGSLKFDFCGPHDCHLALTQAPSDKNPKYEIILGGWKNTQSVIRYNKLSPDKVVTQTPQLMSLKEFRSFVVNWRRGTIMVYGGINREFIIGWVNHEPFNITHFGVNTSWGATGQWRISHFKPSDV